MKLLSTFICLAFVAFAYGDHIAELSNSSFYQTGYTTAYRNEANDISYIYNNTPISEWDDIPKGLRLTVVSDMSVLTSRDDEIQYIWTQDKCTYRKREFYNPFEDNDRSVFYFLPMATEGPDGVFIYFTPDTNFSINGVSQTGNITYTATIVNDSLSMFDFLFVDNDSFTNNFTKYSTFELLMPEFSVYQLPPQCNDIRHLCASCPTPPLTEIKDYSASGTLTITRTNLTTGVEQTLQDEIPYQIWYNFDHKFTRITINETDYIYSAKDNALFNWAPNKCEYEEKSHNFEGGHFIGALSREADEIRPGIYEYKGIDHSFLIDGGHHNANATYTLYTHNGVIEKLVIDTKGEELEHTMLIKFKTFSTDKPDRELFHLPLQCIGFIFLCPECFFNAATALLPTNLIALALLSLLFIIFF